MLNAKWEFGLILHEMPFCNEGILVKYFPEAKIKYPKNEIKNAKPERLERIIKVWQNYEGIKVFIAITSVEKSLFIVDILKSIDFSARQTEVLVNFTAYTDSTYELIPDYVIKVVRDLKCKLRFKYTLAQS